MAPFNYFMNWSEQTEFVGAFIIGIIFGFFLEQGGFGNAKKLAMTFYFRDMTVVKVMFTAIITAMIGSILLSHYGFLDMDQVWLNPTYMGPGIVGAVIMGFGFAIGGYCPGTGLVGCSTLKIDAFYNIGGALLGMAIFGELYPYVEKFYNSGLIGQRATLPEYFNLNPGTVGFGVVIMALVLFIASEYLESIFGKDLKKGH